MLVTFTADTRFDKLSPASSWLDYITPEDTFDVDYGRLLAAAFTRKGWRARTGLPTSLLASIAVTWVTVSSVRSGKDGRMRPWLGRWSL